MSERRDAVRNRAAILDAARSLVTEPGELRLSAVARRAGVGQGTLYRHFPDRDALVTALYAHDIEELVDLADLLLAEHPPGAALRLWFVRLAAYARVKSGVIQAVEADLWSDVSATTLGMLGRALTTLLEAGVGSGELRADVDARDVILLSWSLAHVEPQEWEARVPRLLDVLLSGLAAHPTPEP